MHINTSSGSMYTFMARLMSGEKEGGIDAIKLGGLGFFETSPHKEASLYHKEHEPSIG